MSCVNCEARRAWLKKWKDIAYERIKTRLGIPAVADGGHTSADDQDASRNDQPIDGGAGPG